MRKTFPLEKRFNFKNFGTAVIRLNSTPKSLLGKLTILEKYSKITFWPIFFLFIYFFLKIFFYFWENLKKYLQILKGCKQLPIRCCYQIPANSIKWRAGGRLAPPASRSHTFLSLESWVVLLTTQYVDWVYLPMLEARIDTTLGIRKPHQKKQKVIILWLGQVYTATIVSFFFSPRYLSCLNRYNVGLSSRVLSFVRRSVSLRCSTWVASISCFIRWGKKVENRNGSERYEKFKSHDWRYQHYEKIEI